MRQVAVVVEGQTEEAFVKQVLAPHLLGRGVVVVPVVVATSRAASGAKHKGGGAWQHYRKDLLRLLAEPHWSTVTTMIDFYAYPADGPEVPADVGTEPRARCASLCAAMADDIDHRRFLPFVVLHEFEMLVFAAAVGRATVLGDVEVAAALQAVVAAYGGDVELIDDGPSTAPSKRLAALWPGYQKITDGVPALEEVGLPAVLAHCRSFAAWVDQL
ncbi:DUF4276 family protein [Nocardioides zeae]|uniref:DUF4276 family protein n=1 Tax=Nocardioides zeae TaxID=1457234 RepID=A0A6P0HIT3_9ACTN|nr:DUF4276 family protein [Nocardioides zeae]NEN78622.1 DUF4276 family protein [Nocardioides zeae]